MPLKGLIRDLKDIKNNIGSISGRTFDLKFTRGSRVRSQSGVIDASLLAADDLCMQSGWASLPPELLRDVLQRVESEEGSWPARKDVVACSAVCKTWRGITKELVKTPEESGKLTFPISLKQPGPREGPMQCFIKRDRANATYYLYLGLSPTLVVENSKFLLAARRVRRATSTDYIISLNADDMSRGSSSYVGKLRSNFLGTKFVVYDSQPPHNGALQSSSQAGRRVVSSKQVSPKVPTGSYNVAYIAYELNVLGTRGPRRMQCTMHCIPECCLEAGGSVPTYTDPQSSMDETSASFSRPLSDLSSLYDMDVPNKVEAKGINKPPLVLKNKAPRWHEHLQCWCLNFRGRVTVASVKNFQLVAALEPNPTLPPAEHDKVVLLQFGKIGKDIFTMDYRYPLSAFQAFTICLSSFDTKLACE